MIEELGSYDPMVKNTDERVKLKPDRIKYWMSVGAKPSENVAVLLKKYMAKFESRRRRPPAPRRTPRRPREPAARDRVRPAMRFDVLTLFPEIFQGYLTQSLLKLAIQNGLVEIHLWNIRDWAHGQAQERGRPAVRRRPRHGAHAGAGVRRGRGGAGARPPEPGQLVMLTPAGERLTQALVQELAQQRGCCCCAAATRGSTSASAWACGRARSPIGDFVCNGGEVPAMVVIDTVIRYVPGVLGDAESVAEESHSDPGRLEYPQYTRPRVFRGMAVPEVLLSGDHGAIARWRQEQSRGPQPARPSRG